MVSTRFLGVVSTSMLVVGALSVGQVLHLTVVTGQVGLTATPVVVYGVGGVVALAIGYRARRPIAEEYGLTSDARERGEHERRRSPSTGDSVGAEGVDGVDAAAADGPGCDDGDGFDPAMSPLGDAEPGDAARDRRGDDAGDADR